MLDQTLASGNCRTVGYRVRTLGCHRVGPPVLGCSEYFLMSWFAAWKRFHDEVSVLAYVQPQS